MPLTIKVYSDYVCPFCLLADGQLREAAAERDAAIEHLPFELRPYPTPTLRPEDGYMQASWSEKVYPIAEQLGVPIRMPAISPQPHTHLAFEGYQFARQAGIGEAYHSRMYKAFFQEGLHIGDIDVLTALAEELGLDGPLYREALENGTYREAHRQALHHALYEADITAAPTYVIGNTAYKWLLYKEQFLEAIDAELKKQRLERLEQWSTGSSCTIDGCS